MNTRDLRAAIAQPDWHQHAPQQLDIGLARARALDRASESVLARDFGLVVDPDLAHFNGLPRALYLAEASAVALDRGGALDLHRAAALGRALDLDLAHARDLLRSLDPARDSDRVRFQADLILARGLASALDLAHDLAVRVQTELRALLGAPGMTISRDVGPTRHAAQRLATELATLRKNIASDRSNTLRDLLELFDWVGSIIYGIVEYWVGDPKPEIEGHEQLVRPETLTAEQAHAYAGQFESAFQAIAAAQHDTDLDPRFIDPGVEEDIINLLKQYELAWRRPNVKTQQLELLIVELLELLNGSIEDRDCQWPS